MSTALCAEIGDDALFFPEPGQRTRIAKAICGRCELREACLEAALERKEMGIWGGTTEFERRKIRKARAAA